MDEVKWTFLLKEKVLKKKERIELDLWEQLLSKGQLLTKECEKDGNVVYIMYTD